MGGIIYHIPELVKGHNKARAHPPQTFESPDVNFDSYPLLDAAVQLPQRTAFAYWKHGESRSHSCLHKSQQITEETRVETATWGLKQKGLLKL